MRIGILTGGGDVPGLNSCIKALVRGISEAGHEPIGIRRGWEGLLHYDPDDDAGSGTRCLVQLDDLRVRTVDRTGGTFLHTSRTNPAMVSASRIPDFLKTSGDKPPDLTCHVLKVIEHLRIDLIIVMGGDDTLGYAARLHEEGVPVLSIPKTMDNDVFGTDFCIGFSTAITRAVKLIHQLRSSFGSHERIGVVELFGRHSGQTCLISSYLAGVDRALIAEVPFDIEHLAELLLEDKRSNPSHYAVLAVSEGAREKNGTLVRDRKEDPYGNQKLGGVGSVVARRLKSLVGLRTMCQELAYLMRSGAPDALDAMVAVNYANFALELAFSGKTGRMVALQNGRYTDVAADFPTRGVRRVDVEAFYDSRDYRPKVRCLQHKPMFLY